MVNARPPPENVSGFDEFVSHIPGNGVLKLGKRRANEAQANAQERMKEYAAGAATTPTPTGTPTTPAGTPNTPGLPDKSDLENPLGRSGTPSGISGGILGGTPSWPRKSVPGNPASRLNGAEGCRWSSGRTRHGRAGQLWQERGGRYDAPGGPLVPYEPWPVEHELGPVRTWIRAVRRRHSPLAPVDMASDIFAGCPGYG
jgi:hypothetical protein